MTVSKYMNLFFFFNFQHLNFHFCTVDFRLKLSGHPDGVLLQSLQDFHGVDSIKLGSHADFLLQHLNSQALDVSLQSSEECLEPEESVAHIG